MEKIRSLRAAIEAAIPDLARNPERLLLFVDKGKIASTSRVHASFEYRYEAEVLLVDFSDHLDKVVVACILWAQAHEPDIFQRWRETGEGISFEAELRNENDVDISLKMPLTERVIVRQQPDGSVYIEHAGEPPAPDPLGTPLGTFQKLHIQQAGQPPVDLSEDPAP